MEEAKIIAPPICEGEEKRREKLPNQPKKLGNAAYRKEADRLNAFDGERLPKWGEIGVE
jgi:hypothetical protein